MIFMLSANYVGMWDATGKVEKSTEKISEKEQK